MASADLDLDGDVVWEWKGGFHGLGDLAGEGVSFVGMEVEEEFVVNLEEHF